MPKLELRKKTENDGIVFYSIYNDGSYVSGSCSLEYKTTKNMFDKIIQGLQSVEPVIEILETYDIPENKNN